MALPVLFTTATRERRLADLPLPLELAALLPDADRGHSDADREWEVEIGFGKGRYLLRRAVAEPERRFLGLEIATKYHRLLASRARRDGARNLVAIRGEALYVLDAVLPRAFASHLHVYFPDPWPKGRHHRRRLFHPETVDLALGILRPGGRLSFATDFLDYGEEVATILAGVPELAVTRRDEPWDDGARTNYEAKYMAEGRPILRLAGVLRQAPAIHPQARAEVVVAAQATDAPT